MDTEFYDRMIPAVANISANPSNNSFWLDPEEFPPLPSQGDSQKTDDQTVLIFLIYFNSYFK